jgi:hypothetical protein
MLGRMFVGVVGVAVLSACESSVAPDTSELGSTLDPDGARAPASIANLSVVSSATGSGISSVGASVRVMTFSARERAGGEVQGEYTLVLNGDDRRIAGTRGKLMGTVTCLKVVGDRAFIAGDTRKDDLEAFPLPVGGVAIEVVDDGEGPDAEDQISAIGLFATLDGATAGCEDAVPGPTFQADHGQVQVR